MRARAKPKTAPIGSSVPIVFSLPYCVAAMKNCIVESMVRFMSSCWLYKKSRFHLSYSIYSYTPCIRFVPHSLENRTETEIMIIKGMTLLLADSDERLDLLFSLYDSYHGRRIGRVFPSRTGFSFLSLCSRLLRVLLP